MDLCIRRLGVFLWRAEIFLENKIQYNMTFSSSSECGSLLAANQYRSVFVKLHRCLNRFF